MAKSSHSTFLSMLDIWTLKPCQSSITDYQELQVRPVSSFSSSSPIKFFISSSQEDYLSFAESEIYVKVKLSPEFKSTPTTDIWRNTVAPVNNFLHSLFKKCNVYINNREITNDSSNYSYQAYLQNLLGFSKAAQYSELSTVCYADTNTERKNFLLQFVSSDLKTATFWLGGRLNIDLTFQNKCLIGGTDVLIELLPNDPSFYMELAGDTKSCSVEFEDVVFYCHKFKVSKELQTAHSLALQKAEAKYPFTQHYVKSISIPSGLTQANLDNVYIGNLPRRITVALIPERAYQGDFTKDPFEFISAKVNQFAFYVDGRQYPQTSFKPKFTDVVHNTGSSVIREYRSVLKALGENHSNGKLNISLNDWMKRPFYCYNFAPDLSAGGSHLCDVKSGQMSIHIEFEAALKDPIVVILMAEFDKILQIDKFGSVNLE